MTEADLEKAVDSISRSAKQAGIRDSFFVGGYPRAVAMGLPLSDVHDLDVATASVGKATTLAGLVAEDLKAESEILHRTMSVRLSANGLEIDFQGPMDDPKVIEHLHEIGINPTPLTKNIYARDFTINTLAIHIVEPRIIIDITSRASKDIKSKLISSVLPPHSAVPNNPLMITRALRFSKKYGFQIEENLWAEMKKNSREMSKKLSPERIAVEAFVLSDYDVSKELAELGLEQMASPEMISAGEKAAEE
jgi:tRNA nucleotidyltransferase/poly(A) polymerase